MSDAPRVNKAHKSVLYLCSLVLMIGVEPTFHAQRLRLRYLRLNHISIYSRGIGDAPNAAPQGKRYFTSSPLCQKESSLPLCSIQKAPTYAADALWYTLLL